MNVRFCAFVPVFGLLLALYSDAWSAGSQRSIGASANSDSLISTDLTHSTPRLRDRLARGTLADSLPGGAVSRNHRGLFRRDDPVLALAAADPNDIFWDHQFGRPGPGGLNDPRVHAIEFNGTDMYVGGDFESMSEVMVNCIARWDGARWHALGDGVSGDVRAIAFNGSDVYVGGWITMS